MHCALKDRNLTVIVTGWFGPPVPVCFAIHPRELHRGGGKGSHKASLPHFHAAGVLHRCTDPGRLTFSDLLPTWSVRRAALPEPSPDT
jgi:hypothetical protein